MDYPLVERLLKDAPAIELLRRDKYAPLIISFLSQSFQGDEPRSVILHSDLLLELTHFLEQHWNKDLVLEEGTTVFEQHKATARQYLREWSDARYLRQYPNPDGHDVLELTPDSMLVIRWVEELQPQPFVGTESRFQNIMDRMEELVSKSETDPEKRKEALRLQIAELQLELDNIEASDLQFIRGSYTQAQIWERYLELTKDAKELLSDFRQVEQNFRSVAEELYTRQLEAFESRGRLLGVALDASEAMESSPQGKSFRAFWTYLRQRKPGKQSLEEMAEGLFALMQEHALEAKDGFLQDMKRYLAQAGEQVLKSNRAMVERLRRTLSEEAMAERQRLHEELDQLKHLALLVTDAPPETEEFYFLETTAEVSLPMDRPLGKPKEHARRFNTPQALVQSPEGMALGHLFDEEYVDAKKLRQQIDKLLNEQQSVSLSTVLEHFPLQQGLGEVLAYFSLASHDEQAMIWEKKPIEVVLPGKGKSITVPEIIYGRS